MGIVERQKKIAIEILGIPRVKDTKGAEVKRGP